MRLYFNDILKQTWQTLWAHKLRSFLTMFGIIWGVASLLLLGAVGEGFKDGQRKQMARIGQDLIFVWGGRIQSGPGSLAGGRPLIFTYDDYLAIERECRLVRGVTPVLTRSGIRSQSEFNGVSVEVFGILPNYQQMRYMPVNQGRTFNEEDNRQARRVVLIGDEVRRMLFAGNPALGSTLLLNQIRFEVVGTVQKIGREGNFGTNMRIFVPYETMEQLFPHPRSETHPRATSFLMVQPRTADEHRAAVDEYHRLLAKRHGFDVTDREAVDEWDTIQNTRMLNRIFDAMNLFLGGVGIVTLALGAIGVMNIMLVSVSERTQEIGVRKALGATRRDIELQFFLESLMLTLTSGLVGMGLGWIVAQELQRLDFPDGFSPPTITWPIGLVAAGVLSLVAIGSGLYPARQAAQLPPVEAIRHEA